MSYRTIAGHVRLDNRAELTGALDIPSARIGDLDLVLLAYDRWGVSCPEKLLGDFAFVIDDRAAGRTFGARDHLGASPFYYRVSPQGLAFATRASLVPAEDGLPVAIDERRIADALLPALECVDRTSTFFRDVFRLPPGHRIELRGGDAAIAAYWAPDPVRELRLDGDRDYVDAFRSIFEEAVRCRLTGAAASMLSGGLDSSAIVGFAPRPLTTLSAVTTDPRCEESRHIAAMLALGGLDPIVIRPDDVERLSADVEEPFDDTMIVPGLLYEAARRRGVDAVLDGVDGDVVASHEPDALDDVLRGGRFGAAVREARAIGRFYAGTYAPWASAWRVLAGSAGRVLLPELVRAASRPFRMRSTIDAAVSQSVVSRRFARDVGISERFERLFSHRAGYAALSARERQARELTHPQIAAALERYHRVAAHSDVEARHPLMDLRVVEFCLSLPREQKLRDGWSKWILRAAAEGLVPDGVRWRRGRWIRLGPRFLAAAISASKEMVDDELAGEMSELSPYVDVPKVRELHRRHRSGDPSAGEAVWKVAVLSSWLRKTRRTRYDAAARANGHGTAPRLPRAG